MKTLANSSTDRSATRRRRWTFFLAVAPALLILSIRVAWFHNQNLVPSLMVDDAYISFRYARNLVQGEGLVFNPGERVEGYTNFLWTVLVAGGMAAGAAPETTAELLAGAAAVATVVLLAGLSRRLLRGRLAALAAVLPATLYAALGSQARHVVSGMETLLFGFLVLAAFSAVLWHWRSPADDPGSGGATPSGRAAAGAGVLFALASMTRPEGALFAGLGGLLVLLWPGGGQRWFHGLSERLRPAALLFGTFLAVYGPYTAWRVSYYGHLLPNTFYAKVAGPRYEVLARGWKSLGELMGQWPVWPLLLAAALALVPLRSLRRDPLWAWHAAVVLATWTSFVLVGGDFIDFFGPRMLMPALPFLLLLAAEGLRRAAAAVPARRVGAALLATALVALTAHELVQPWPKWSGHLGGLAVAHRWMYELGTWLIREEPSGASLATGGAGIVPYVTGWPTIDMYGLVDAHIAHDGVFDPAMPSAHARSDPGYVLDRQPKYLVANLNRDGVARNARLGWVADRVRREYELVAQVKVQRGKLAQGRRVLEVDGFRPALWQRGYRLGIFRRLERRQPTT